MKKLRYIAESAVLHTLLLVFSSLPVDKASALGGWLTRTIGPHLGASKKAHKNLSRAFPKMDEEQKQTIITDMWDNLGRIIAEYPHLKEIVKERLTVQHKDLLQTTKEPIVFIAAHLANWEVLLPSLYLNHNIEAHGLYRAPNNPWTDRLLSKLRSVGGRIKAHPKSKSGALALLRSLKEGRSIALLIDQKYNEGVPVPFFGYNAMTSAAFLDMAKRFKTPILGVRLERKDGVEFEATLFDLTELRDLSTTEALLKTHEILESWIKENPAQWLWLHRRWPKDSK